MCFTNGCHKDQWQNQTELARFKIAGKLGSNHHFPSLDLSLFLYQLLRAEGHFAWFTPVFVSKLPGVWQRCSAVTFWEIYALGDRQQLTTPKQLWLDRRTCLRKMKAWDALKLSLLPYHSTISARRGFCALLSTMPACAKEPGSLYMPSCPQLPQEISTLFLKPWWPFCLLPLKMPLFPHLGEKLSLQHEFSFSIPI